MYIVHCTLYIGPTWCSDQPWAQALPWRHQGFSQNPPLSRKPGQEASDAFILVCKTMLLGSKI